jgi:phenylacetic acid degradation operon negative regulatory protein
MHYLGQPPLSEYFARLNLVQRVIALRYLCDRLMRAGLIEAIVGEDLAYRLTWQGKQRLSRASLHRATIPLLPSWDGHWRAVIFHLPGEKNAKRQAIRLELKRLGLVCVRPGFWIYPFPFADIAEQLVTVYNAQTDMAYLEITQTGHDTLWQSYFAELL